MKLLFIDQSNCFICEVFIPLPRVTENSLSFLWCFISMLSEEKAATWDLVIMVFENKDLVANLLEIEPMGSITIPFREQKSQ